MENKAHQKRFIICTDGMRVTVLDADIYKDDGLFAHTLRQLPDDRRRKIESYRFHKDKCLSMAASVLLKELLEQHSADSARIVYGQYGKPAVETHPEIRFNLSHSGHLSACAWISAEDADTSLWDIGLDIEEIAGVEKALIERVCTPSEQSHLKGLSGRALRRDFFRIWTAKESYMKATGLGFALSPQEIEIDLSDGARIAKPTPETAVLSEMQIEGYRLCVCKIPNARARVSSTVCGEKNVYIPPFPGGSACARHEMRYQPRK